MHIFFTAFRQFLTDVLQASLGSSAEGTGHWLYQLFLLPGEILLMLVINFEPELVSRFGPGLLDLVGDLPRALSVLIWGGLLVSIGPIRHRLKMYVRMFIELLRVVPYSIRAQLHVTRPMRRSFLKRISMGRIDDDVNLSAEAKLSDLDIAVLEAEAQLGPGFSLTAPDIAESLRVRPAQAQETLDKLKKLELINDSIGTQDGFAGYQITESGRFVVTSVGLRKTNYDRPSVRSH